MTTRSGEHVLEPGEVAVCVHCQAVARADFIDPDQRCAECGQGGVVVRDVAAGGTKVIASRWGEDVAACGHVATSNLLREHLKALGLRALDYLLLDELESYRRSGDPGEAAFPGVKRMVDRLGYADSTIRGQLDGLCKRGLIERQEVRSSGARWDHNAYTRRGLTRLLATIAANRRAGRDDLAGVPDLLEELQRATADHRASVRGGATAGGAAVDATAGGVAVADRPPHRRRGSGGPGAPATAGGAAKPPPEGQQSHRHPSGAEVEVVEVEAEEADSPNGAPIAPSRDGGPLLVDVLGSEEAVVEAFIEAFDAVEEVDW